MFLKAAIAVESDDAPRRRPAASASAHASAPALINGKDARLYTPKFTVEESAPLDLSSWRSVLPCYVCFLLAAFYLLGFYTLNFWVLPWFVFACIPLLDLLIPLDTANPTDEESKEHENDLRYKMPLYLWVPTQLTCITLAIYALVSNSVVGPWARGGLLLSTGLLSGGLGITVSHELFHKLSRWERFMGHLLLCSVNYMHFSIEHLSGHHKRVATPDDPASAKEGDNVYLFYPKSLVGSWLSAWKDEKERLHQAGAAVFGPQNRMIWFMVLPALMASAYAYVFGTWWAAVYFYGQGWIAHTLLEVVNYLEHYGLRRKEVAPGVYERVNITHSWNSPHTFSNFLLFKLQRHSDHHANALRRYHTLRCFQESPQLPTGYAGMLIIALFPPLWFSLMNPLVKKYNESDDKKQTALATKATPAIVYVFTAVVFVTITLAVFVAPMFFS